MLQRSPSDSSAARAPYISAHPRRHLLSTFIITSWALFIILTVVIHEVAYRASWNFDDARLGFDLPWIIRPGIGIPTIMRTAFTQAHGPITAMHLARLAVNTLNPSWASPKTWMEVFWLADRRWAGPVGLGKTGWTVASRRLRVSFGFILLAALNLVALVTPVVMTRTYSVTVGDAKRFFGRQVPTIDLSIMARLSRGVQLSVGNEIWSKGLPATAMFPRNIYSGTEIWSTGSPVTEMFPKSIYSGTETSDFPEWLFLSGDSIDSGMELAGVFVAGNCNFPRSTSEATCSDRPTRNWDLNAKPSIPYIGPVNISLTGASVCSRIDLSMPFGQYASSLEGFPGELSTEALIQAIPPATALFQFRSSMGDFMADCRAKAAPGIALVDGRNMTFSRFNYKPPQFKNPPQEVPVHPLAAVMQTDWLSLERSVNLKLDRIIKKPVDYNGTLERIIPEALWEGVLAMTAAVWLESEGPGKVVPGIMRITRTGMQRNHTAFCALITLLGVWFVGMFGATAILLRPTWASSLDGYAAARMLLQKEDLVVKPEAWFAELEENSDMLEPFVPEHVHLLSNSLVRRSRRTDAL